MKTVVITGSARGLGFEMAKVFRRNNVNVMLSDLDEQKLKAAKSRLEKEEGNAGVAYAVCDVTKPEDIQNLIKEAKENFLKIDIWINNAGVNQPEKPIWELSEQEINTVIDVDLKGAIFGSKYALLDMMEEHEGAIYNIEGYGSNDAKMLGLSVYGTSKRAITYFTQALAKNLKKKIQVL